MGMHRRVRSGPRGVSRGIVIGAASVAVVVLLIVGWMRLREVSTEQGVAAAERCVEGSATLQVVADPTIDDAVRQVAEQYNATEPVIRDRCVQVEVEAADSGTAVERINGGNAAPGLWIAPNSTAAARVADRTSAAPRSIAASPVVVAAGTEALGYLQAANPTWGALPGLLADADAPSPVLPIDPMTDAAATAMVSDSLGLGTAAPTEADVTSGAGRRVLANIGAASLRDTGSDSASTPNTSSDSAPVGLDMSRALETVAGSAATVTFATEQSVAQSPGLSAFAPVGAAPIADYPAVVPSVAAGRDDSSIAIAGEFLSYARGDGMPTFLSAGFVPVEQIATPRPADSPQVADLVASALAQPIGVSTTTVLVDVSPAAAATENGATIRATVGAAVADVLERLPDAARVGVVTYGTTAQTPPAYVLDIPTGVLSAPGADGSATHRDRMIAALRNWSPTAISDADGDDAADSYGALITGYRTAVANWTADMPNRVIVISVAAEDDSLSASSAAAQVDSAIDAGRPVSIDAILVGSEPNRNEWEQLTDPTDGRTEQVGTAAGFELPNLLATAF